MVPQNNDRIPIQCPAELANGVYANLGVANFNHEEFVLDFIFLHPNTKTGKSVRELCFTQTMCDVW